MLAEEEEKKKTAEYDKWKVITDIFRICLVLKRKENPRKVLKNKPENKNNLEKLYAVI